ncbi:DNA-methyltransferase [Mesorhizobium sp. NZP2298]|uniref:DNA-methyltransferase n=1 Tax=Mesorhizobium sp. NZP2298 TaxID=2483403 RepID=UPI001555011C|nr:site-specific DNA-methyltransferase [Mesorhizobium sp. NZP2298]QKC99142.1 site-specific DNA-methyltransferase [Mesorhizobium sp. NZP2298]
MENFDVIELHQGDSAKVLASLPAASIDLTVTSPPYDNLRTYKGYTFDFETIARNLYRVTKSGGVVVWNVGDATVGGSETGTSFRQALFFKDVCGFNLHDTMIWNKGCFSAVGALAVRYAPVFEYMFVLSKGAPKTFNPIKDKPNKWAGDVRKHVMNRQADGTTTPSKGYVLGAFGQRYNIWDMPPQRQRGESKHPAPFPESLARDHILSWSNPGDVVLDPFLGSGTTGKMAVAAGRKFVGIEISDEYLAIARQRICGPVVAPQQPAADNDNHLPDLFALTA